MIWLLADVGPTPDPLGMTSSTGSVTQSLALDLSQGPINDLCTQTTSLALRLFVVFGLIALIVEAFGHGPGHRRDYAGLAWRAVVVLLLLKFYAPIFGSVIVTTQTIADQFKPMEANDELSSQTALMQGKLRVRGNLSKLSGRAGDLAGLDPVPAAVRKTTTF